MKRMIYLSVMWFSAIACSKDSGSSNKLQGVWQLSAMYLQTNGPGSWHQQEAIPPDYIRFNSDGSLAMSDYVSLLFNGPVGYTVLSDSRIAFRYADGGFHIGGDNIVGYQLSDTILTITPPSIEYVVEKFRRK